jgi:hypothetical protein
VDSDLVAFGIRGKDVTWTSLQCTNLQIRLVPMMMSWTTCLFHLNVVHPVLQLLTLSFVPRFLFVMVLLSFRRLSFLVTHREVQDV